MHKKILNFYSLVIQFRRVYDSLRLFRLWRSWVHLDLTRLIVT